MTITRDHVTEVDNCRQITDAAHAREFILGGNATITLKSAKTGARFTYRVSRCKDNDQLYFVALMAGPDNESDFNYLGVIRTDGPTYTHGRKSHIGHDAPSAVGFQWFILHLLSGRLPAQVELWHEGRCCRCGRKLTVPESIESGWGPECKKMRLAA